ncbi:MAG TPA: ABC transporter ATP-binding protein [Nitriliruptorales bacterium]|nr:ABC transporter ATP-binding protein [Nitriliruptorales bacterium]
MSGRAPWEPAGQGAWHTLQRGLRLSPEFRVGVELTLLLAVVATAGRVVVPVAVQLTIDRGLLAPGGLQVGVVLRFTALALAAVVVTGVAGSRMHLRLARATETALSGLRVRAFRHIHDLSVLHQSAETRGSLTSRVTSDVDQISQFMQWGGLVMLVSLAQLVLTTTVMALYSWELTLVTVACMAPLVVLLRDVQRRLSAAYDVVRQRVGDMLAVIGESVVGAPVIRAYRIQERTNRRLTVAIDRHFDATFRAARISALMFSSGEVFAAVATAAVVVVGVLLGVGGELSAGRVVAFMFLISLFVGPVQVAAEILERIQTAVAGWRRVLAVLDTPPDIADPGEHGQDIPPGPIGVRVEGMSFSYARIGRGDRGPRVLHDLSVEIPARSRVAVVGETGSGKTTFAKLLARLLDPERGRILVSGVPLDQVRFASLRPRIVLVPQDDVLFDGSVEDNVRYGRPSATSEDVRLAFIELGLDDWVDTLPHGLRTRVGERGQFVSVGERQLVALARAWVANPDLLILDEATSAVDPVTEARLRRALEGLTRGRTALTIAHRLSTAQAADEVLVFDDGRIVQRGPHTDLVRRPGVYARLWASWNVRGRDRRAAGEQHAGQSA